MRRSALAGFALNRARASVATTSPWAVDGAPRYLGYNGPFVLPPWRYGEVVVPVRERDVAAATPRS